MEKLRKKTERSFNKIVNRKIVDKVVNKKVVNKKLSNPVKILRTKTNALYISL